MRFMTSKRSRSDADAFPENFTSNKRRVPDSSDGVTSISPDGEGHFGEIALIFLFQWPGSNGSENMCTSLSTCRVSGLISLYSVYSKPHST